MKNIRQLDMNENLKIIYGILRDEYSDYDIPEENLREFAEELYESVFVDECELNDILSIVYYYEEQMRAEGATIEVGRQCVIYEVILRYLDRNETNARRLYDSFLSYHDVMAFVLLMDTFDVWLTQEEWDEVLEIGKKCFIKSVWESYT